MKKDVQYLACTRGAEGWLGLPAGAWGTMIYTCYLGYMTVGAADILHFRGYGWGIAFVLCLAGMRWAIEKDPNIFRIFKLLVDTYSIRPVLQAAPARDRKARSMASAF
jgi:hypothetical protein